MYKAYIVPDATILNSHSEIYTNMELFWDPRAESDAFAIIGPKLKSEGNKASSFEFTVIPTSAHYADFAKRKSVVVLYDDDEWLFEGIVKDCPIDFYKQRKVTCCDPLSYFSDSVQAPDEKNVAEVPGGISGDRYISVPTAWHDGADPKALSWYERTVSNGRALYTLTADTAPNASKQYYILETSTGDNVSGVTITRQAATSESVNAHLTRLVGVHNAQVDPFKQIQIGTISNSYAGTGEHDFKSSNYRTTWEAITSDLVNAYGCYLIIRLGTDHNLYLDYKDWSPTADGSKPKIEFASNMLEMNESDNTDDDVFTVLVPTGKDNMTVEDASGHGSPEHNDGREIDPYIASMGGNRRYIVVSPAALKEYGYVIKTYSFSDVEDANTLYSRAVEYIILNYLPCKEYEVKGIDMHLLGDTSRKRVAVGEQCRLVSKWHEVDEKTLYVLSADLDLENPENDSYKIGVPTADRNARNNKSKTVSGQTASNASNSRAAAGGYSSGMSAMGSVLDNYIHVTEWGLELNSRLKNEVESADQMYKTRFLQDEYHLNLAAQKIFGENPEDTQDAGYIAVPYSDYKDNNGAAVNPSKQHWYVKTDGKYVQTNATVADLALKEDENGNMVPNTQYYMMRLWTRYSEVDVGPGGIKAKVDGNYERSTASSSWITMNEDSITALTGHIYVDENGQVIIDSGSGFRTGHLESKTDATFLSVPNSWLSKRTPQAAGWYERVMDSSGSWIGLNKTDSATNASYYKLSTDQAVIAGKQYYYISRTKEELSADFGVYDENNLTAGVIARTVNFPHYVKVPGTEVAIAAKQFKDAHELGWYLYNETTGTFGLAVSGSTVIGSITYYRPDNNMTQTACDIYGEHIVIGRTPEYSGMDPTTKSRVDKYIADHNLNGTITEIASDVVTVHALFARFIHWDDAEGDTLHVFGATFDEVQVENEILIGGFDYDDDSTTYIVGDTILTPLLEAHEIYARDSLNIGSIQFTGDGLEGVTSVSTDASAIVTGFGTITTSGDTVTIPYRTAGMDDFDTTHVLFFDKPASLGTVTWSNGSGGAAAANKSLVVQTLGGKEFFRATVTIPSVLSGSDLTYERNGTVFGAGSAINGKPAIKATQNLSATWTDHTTDPSADDDVVWSKDLYFDATAPYNDGISVAKGKFGLTGPSAATVSTQAEAQSLNNATTLSYGSSYMVYKTYDGAQLGDKKYFKTPSKGNYRTYAKYGTTEYTSGTIPLSYGETITVYGQRKMDGDSNYQNATGIQIKAPTDNSGPSIDYSDIRVGNIDIKTTNPGSSYTELDWASTIASAEGHWFVFEAWISGQSGTRKYKINLT